MTINPRVPLTVKQTQLVDAMNHGLDTKRWEIVPGHPFFVIRYTETVPTPDVFRHRSWPEPEYQRHVFINIVTGRPWSITLRRAAAPWVAATDSKITLSRACEIVTNPETVWN
ncbi:hypothetical protein ACW9HH_32570 [Nocardia gipuzkoensis]